jgi:hypothetical protein
MSPTCQNRFQGLESYSDDEENSTVVESSFEDDAGALDCSEDEGDTNSDVEHGLDVPHRNPAVEVTPIPKARWADMSDDENIVQCNNYEQSEVASATAVCRVATKASWADLVDDCDEDSSAQCNVSTPNPIVPSVSDESLWQRRRVDPYDGRSYTYEEISDYYAGRYNQVAIDKYWTYKCKVEESHGTNFSVRGVVGSSGYATQAGTKGKWAKTNAVKHQCQFIIGIEEDAAFQVVKKICSNTKRIAERTDAKLRLRGRGSRFLEGKERLESTDDLMLCVTCCNKWGFDEACGLVRDLLDGDIYNKYKMHCRRNGEQVPDLSIQVHEGPRDGSR